MQILDNITLQYLQVAQPWFGAVFGVANKVFISLAIIQITWSSIMLALKKNDADSMIVSIIIKVLVLGFFYTLILYAGTWLPAIINSFIKIGQMGGPITKLDPSSVVDQGLSIAGGLLQGIGAWGFIESPVGALIGAFSSICIVIMYVLVAAELTITLIESYFIIASSTLFFAFGASRWTSPMAKRFIEESIGIGLKLMMLYLMIAVGSTLGNDWAKTAHDAANNHQILPFLGIAGAAIVYYLIVKNVPGKIARLAGCGSLMNYGDAAAGTAITAAAMGAKTAATVATGGKSALLGTVSAGATGFQTGRFASQAYSSTGGGLKGAMGAAGMTAKGIGSSMMDSFKRNLQSNSGNLHHNMKGGADAMKAERMKTTPPSGGIKTK